MVNECKDEGADIIVIAFAQWIDVDKKMASKVDGIDVILSGHTHVPF